MSKILAITALLLTTIAMWGEAAQRYVVLDGFSGVARVHNASDNSEVAVIRAGPLPNSAVISPNGRLVFVAAEASQYVSVIDLTIQAEIKRIRDVGPDQLAMSADGKKIVATSFPDPVYRVPCSMRRESRRYPKENSGLFRPSVGPDGAKLGKIPVLSLQNRDFRPGDRFVGDCIHSHALALSLHVCRHPGDLEKMPPLWGPLRSDYRAADARDAGS